MTKWTCLCFSSILKMHTTWYGMVFFTKQSRQRRYVFIRRLVRWLYQCGFWNLLLWTKKPVDREPHTTVNVLMYQQKKYCSLFASSCNVLEVICLITFFLSIAFMCMAWHRFCKLYFFLCGYLEYIHTSIVSLGIRCLSSNVLVQVP